MQKELQLKVVLELQSQEFQQNLRALSGEFQALKVPVTVEGAAVAQVAKTIAQGVGDAIESAGADSAQQVAKATSEALKDGGTQAAQAVGKAVKESNTGLGNTIAKEITQGVKKTEFRFGDAIAKEIKNGLRGKSFNIGNAIADEIERPFKNIRYGIADAIAEEVNKPIKGLKFNPGETFAKSLGSVRVGVDGSNFLLEMSQTFNEVVDALSKVFSSGGGIFEALTTPLRNMIRGYQEGVGLTYADVMTRGQIRAIEKRVGVPLDAVGEIVGETVADLGSTAGQSVIRQVVPEGDVEKVKQDLKAVGEVLREALAVEDADASLNRLEVAAERLRQRKAEKIATAAEMAREQAAGEQQVSVPENARAVTFVVGGYAGAGGTSGEQNLAPVVQGFLGPENAVIPQSNRATDLSVQAAEAPARWVAEAGKKLLDLKVAQGYNQDAVELVSKVLQAREQNPEIPVQLLGYSAGGFVTEEAQQILNTLGVQGVSSLGLGTPALGKGQTAEGYTGYIGAADPIGLMTKGVGINRSVAPEQAIDVGVSHAFEDYLLNPQVQQAIYGNIQQETPQGLPQNRAELTLEQYKAQSQQLTRLAQSLQESGLPPEVQQNLGPQLIEQIKSQREQLNRAISKVSESTRQDLQDLESYYQQLEAQVNGQLTVKADIQSEPTNLYQAIVEQVGKASGVAIPPDLIPQLKPVALAEGAGGSYSSSENAIQVSPERYEEINSGVVSQNALKVLVHELRHALQLQGAIKPDDYLSANAEERGTLQNSIDFSVDQAPGGNREDIRKIEEDAYVFTYRYFNEIYDAIAAQVEQATQDAGTKAVAESKNPPTQVVQPKAIAPDPPAPERKPEPTPDQSTQKPAQPTTMQQRFVGRIAEKRQQAVDRAEQEGQRQTTQQQVVLDSIAGATQQALQGITAASEAVQQNLNTAAGQALQSIAQQQQQVLQQNATIAQQSLQAVALGSQQSTQEVATVAAQALQEIAQLQQKTLQSISAQQQASLQLITTTATQAVQEIGQRQQQLAQEAATVAGQVLQDIAQLQQKALQSISAQQQESVQLLGTAITQAVQSIGQGQQQALQLVTQEQQQVLQRGATAAQQTVQTLAASGQDSVQQVAKAVTQALQSVAEFQQTTFHTLGAQQQESVQVLVTAAAQSLQQIDQGQQRSVQTISTAQQEALQAITARQQQILEAISASGQQVLTTIAQQLSEQQSASGQQQQALQDIAGAGQRSIDQIAQQQQQSLQELSALGQQTIQAVDARQQQAVQEIAATAQRSLEEIGTRQQQSVQELTSLSQQASQSLEGQQRQALQEISTSSQQSLEAINQQQQRALQELMANQDRSANEAAAQQTLQEIAAAGTRSLEAIGQQQQQVLQETANQGQSISQGIETQQQQALQAIAQQQQQALQEIAGGARRSLDEIGARQQQSVQELMSLSQQSSQAIEGQQQQVLQAIAASSQQSLEVIGQQQQQALQDLMANRGQSDNDAAAQQRMQEITASSQQSLQTISQQQQQILQEVANQGQAVSQDIETQQQQALQAIAEQQQQVLQDINAARQDLQQTTEQLSQQQGTALQEIASAGPQVLQEITNLEQQAIQSVDARQQQAIQAINENLESALQQIDTKQQEVLDGLAQATPAPSESVPPAEVVPKVIEQPIAQEIAAQIREPVDKDGIVAQVNELLSGVTPLNVQATPVPEERKLRFQSDDELRQVLDEQYKSDALRDEVLKRLGLGKPGKANKAEVIDRIVKAPRGQTEEILSRLGDTAKKQKYQGGQESFLETIPDETQAFEVFAKRFEKLRSAIKLINDLPEGDFKTEGVQSVVERAKQQLKAIDEIFRVYDLEDGQALSGYRSQFQGLVDENQFRVPLQTVLAGTEAYSIENAPVAPRANATAKQVDQVNLGAYDKLAQELNKLLGQIDGFASRIQAGAGVAGVAARSAKQAAQVTAKASAIARQLGDAAREQVGKTFAGKGAEYYDLLANQLDRLLNEVDEFAGEVQEKAASANQTASKVQQATQSISQASKTTQQVINAVGEGVKAAVSEPEIGEYYQNLGKRTSDRPKKEGQRSNRIAETARSVAETTVREAPQYIDALGRNFAKSAEEASGLGRRLSEANERLGVTSRALNLLGGGLRFALSHAKGLVVGFIAFQVLDQIVPQLIEFGKAAFHTAANLDALQTSLSFVSGSASAGAEQMAFVRQEADRLNLPLQASAKGYTQLAAATQNTTLEGQKTQEMFSALVQAGRVYNLTQDEMNGLLLASSQIMSKGSVAAEELRGQIAERLPGAYNKFADALGISTEELSKRLQLGQVSTEDFYKFTQKLAADTASGVDAANSSAQAATARLGNEFTKLQESIGRAATPAVIAVMNGLGVALGLVAAAGDNVVQFFNIIGTLLGGIAKLVGPVVVPALQLLGEMFDNVTFNGKAAEYVLKAIATLIAIKLIPVVYGLAVQALPLLISSLGLLVNTIGAVLFTMAPLLPVIAAVAAAIALTEPATKAAVFAWHGLSEEQIKAGETIDQFGKQFDAAMGKLQRGIPLTTEEMGQLSEGLNQSVKSGYDSAQGAERLANQLRVLQQQAQRAAAEQERLNKIISISERAYKNSAAALESQLLEEKAKIAERQAQGRLDSDAARRQELQAEQNHAQQMLDLLKDRRKEIEDQLGGFDLIRRNGQILSDEQVKQNQARQAAIQKEMQRLHSRRELTEEDLKQQKSLQEELNSLQGQKSLSDDQLEKEKKLQEELRDNAKEQGQARVDIAKRSIEQANQAILDAESERQVQIQNLLNARVINEDDANLRVLASDRQRILEQIAQEGQTSKLRLELAKNEQSQQDALAQIRVKQIEEAETKRQIAIQQLANRQVITQEEANLKTLASDKQRIRDQMQNERLTAAEREKLNLELLRNEQAQLEAHEAIKSKEIEYAEVNRQIEIQRLTNNRTLTEEQANLEILRSDEQRIRDQLQNERLYTNERARLTLELLKNEQAQQEALREAVTRRLDEQVLAAQNAAESQKIALNAVSSILEQQNKLLEARKGLMSSFSNLRQGEFDIAAKLTEDEEERKKLEEAAAIDRLNSLRAAHRLEQQILEVKLLQEEAQRRTALVQNQAETLKAVAELEKVKADPKSTAAQIQAAELGVVARVAEGQMLKQADAQAGRLGQMQREQLGNEQLLADRNARFDLSEKTLNPFRREQMRDNLKQEVMGGLGLSQRAALYGTVGDLAITPAPQPSFEAVDVNRAVQEQLRAGGIIDLPGYKLPDLPVRQLANGAQNPLQPLLDQGKPILANSLTEKLVMTVEKILERIGGMDMNQNITVNNNGQSSQIQGVQPNQLQMFRQFALETQRFVKQGV